jgi:hypothetical protein
MYVLRGADGTIKTVEEAMADQAAAREAINTDAQTMYVLRWPDGTYNLRSGFEANLTEATRYPTIQEAMAAREEINTDAQIMSLEEALAVEESRAVSLQELVEAVDAATRTITVCVPSTDYYRSSDAWTEETLTFVDAGHLLELLKELR